MTAQRRSTQGAFIPAEDATHATGPMQEPRPSEATDPKKVAKKAQPKDSKKRTRKTPSKGRSKK